MGLPGMHLSQGSVNEEGVLGDVWWGRTDQRRQLLWTPGHITSEKKGPGLLCL